MPVTYFALKGRPLEVRVPWWPMPLFIVPEVRHEDDSSHRASILAPATEAIDAEEQHRREMPPVRLASREGLRYSWDRSQESGGGNGPSAIGVTPSSPTSWRTTTSEPCWSRWATGV